MCASASSWHLGSLEHYWVKRLAANACVPTWLQKTMRTAVSNWWQICKGRPILSGRRKKKEKCVNFTFDNTGNPRRRPYPTTKVRDKTLCARWVRTLHLYLPVLILETLPVLSSTMVGKCFASLPPWKEIKTYCQSNFWTICCSINRQHTEYKHLDTP